MTFYKWSLLSLVGFSKLMITPSTVLRQNLPEFVWNWILINPFSKGLGLNMENTLSLFLLYMKSFMFISTVVGE